MTAKEAITYIENYSWSTTRLGLDRTKALLAAIGDPQKKLKFIHVAGSNGKGSTCAMLAEICKQAGYRTGLYISPYIQEFTERIQIDGVNIPGERLAEITERVKKIADEMEDHPSQFELVTAIAIEYYYEEHCDLVVLEVGMGGALDSTNAIDAPEVAVITNIGLEHTEYLGNTLEEIATTKSGIIKAGSSVVCYDGAPEVTDVVRERAASLGCSFRLADHRRLTPLAASLDGQEFRWEKENGDPVTYRLALLGEHQLYNTCVVLTVCEALAQRGFSLPEAAIRAGLEQVKWPARFEVLDRDPLFILDGGHNPQCAEALAKSVRELLPDRKIVFLLGVLADKDYGGILDLMLPLAEEFICLTPVSDRALPAEDLAAFIQEKGGQAVAVKSIPAGIKTALLHAAALDGGAVIAFGSLYLAGAVRTEFRASYRRFMRSCLIKAREAQTEEERETRSQAISRLISAMPEYERAQTVMIYKWTRGEVRLDLLEEINREAALPKRFLYPLCLDEGEMIAIEPGSGEDAWKDGAFGIREPLAEKGHIVPPEEIDLVICPMSGFDERGNRIGMGGGFYDRYLPKCARADVVAVAYEVQKVTEIPTEDHDVAMPAVVTEEKVYRFN
ncbi:MAG: 5-formyltetrahydrofolate cyclo-ligase [Clostridia bacterium]|nr:5-formyltetrahydrofolate cyclo-ligase [Clostridia bacterium]